MRRPGRRWLAVAGLTAAAVAAAGAGAALLAHGVGAANGSPGQDASLVPARPSVVAEPPASPVLPVMTHLDGVSCPSARMCLATGPTTASTTTGPTTTGPTTTGPTTTGGTTTGPTTTGGTSAVVRWNGVKWTALPTPGPAKDQLAAIWCTSADSCLAVGGTRLNASGSKEAPLAQRWNGSVWTVLPIPDPAHAVQSYLTDIDCTSATACTAVGTYTYSPSGTTSYALAEGWNGKAWRLEPAANPVPEETMLDSVSCLPASGCEAVGSGAGYGPLAEWWNGTAWTEQTPVPSAGGGPGDFNGVSCASASYCIAVGDTGGDDNQTMIEGWNGKHWTYMPSLAPSDYSSFSDVACWSASDCLGVGVTDGLRGDITLAARLTGHGWIVLPTRNAPRPALDSSLDALSCASSVACLAVGDSDQANGGAHPRALAEWWNGTRWTMLPSP
jgi:hypothetical protein